jgi:ABC-2 type transport system permease protein
MFGGGQQPEPKGDITELWKLLGVEMYGDEIVWQDFNPEPKLGEIYKEWVFVDESLGDQKSANAVQPFDPDDPISAGMKQVLFFWPGSFRPADGSKMHFQKLAVTGRDSGTISYQDVDMSLRSGNAMGVRRVATHEPYIIAAHVTGNITDETGRHLTSKDDKDAKAKGADAAKSEPQKDAKPADGKTDEGKEKSADKKAADDDALAGKAPEKTKIDVVLVADIDWIAPIIFRLREMGQDPDSVIDFKFQNVAFVLNILDSLAKDDRFIDLRKRTRSHRILTKIEEATEEQRKDSLEEQSKFVGDARQQIDAAQDEYRKKMADLEKREDLDPRVKEQMMDRERIRLERMRDVNIAHAEKERNKQVKQSERELASKIRGVQDRYKLLAVLLPPIPPIVLAFFVFFNRRKAEQEGVDTRRLRFGKGKEPVA